MSDEIFVRYSLIAIGRHGYIAVRKLIILPAVTHGFSIILTPLARLCPLGLSYEAV